MRTHRILLICVVALLYSWPVCSAAASFNCAKAKTPNEVMICGDPQLSVMDDDLAALYRAAKAVAKNTAAFKKETTEEWHRRENCTDRDCLVGWYNRRIAQLAAALNHAQIARVPTHPVAVQSPPAKPVAVAVPPADGSSGISTIVLAIAGLCGFFWVANKIQVGQRRIAAAKLGAPAAKSEPGAGQPAELILTGKAAGSRSRREVDIKLSDVRVNSVQSPESVAAAKAGKRMPTVWIPPGQSVVVTGVTIPGGMLYVGSTLLAPDGDVEPAQIDPTLSVDPHPGNLAESLFGYWARYGTISPTARRAYLTWLANGRRDPNANIGYVFLFFYGLERRVLVEATDATAAGDIQAIVAEIERLRLIYDNNSFLRYSSDLLDFLASGAAEEASYLKAPPPATANRGMSLRLRVGLGQCAVEGHAVSAEWALAWARSEANVHLPGVTVRCAAKFDAQFKRLYQEKFGDGIRLTVNRTKLKIGYRPASPGLQTQSFTANLGELPDVTTVVTPLKKLQGIVHESAEGLAAYSRFIGRHADRALSLEATLLLPQVLWPRTVKDAVQSLDARIGGGMVVIKLGELLAAFGGTSTLTRESLKNLFVMLQERNVGAEPDVLAGAKAPKPDDSVVLFRLASDESAPSARNYAGYEAVAVMLDLAITLANADGNISGREVQFLNAQVDAWSHVGATAQRRLRARLRLGIVYPPTLASLKSRIEPLPTTAREALAKLLSGLALADGKLRPAAVKHLEKVYQLLGLEGSALYSELHVASAAAEPRGISGPAPSAPKSRKEGGFKLDAARIAALQRDSERVTAMLSKVFEEQEPAAPVAVPLPLDLLERDLDEKTPRLLGLDSEHSTFLRVLLTRPSWTRAEVADIAADMELMLDGALERVNEAALDAYDNRIADGDDPIEIAQDLMENASA
ncbi:MAG: hypothetical protein JWN43_2766 [Gammaproteobacteria bacterium]|nr:hypothetical protein [Gammaproteobacteria bacterium]